MGLYFIAYEAIANRGGENNCVGSVQIERDKPIVNYEDIENICDKIADKYKDYLPDSIVVTNWRRFEEPE